MPPKKKFTLKYPNNGNKKRLVSMKERYHGRCADCMMWYNFKYMNNQVCMNCRNATELQTRGITTVAIKCNYCTKFFTDEEGKSACVICKDMNNEASSSESSTSDDMKYESSSSDEEEW